MAQKYEIKRTAWARLSKEKKNMKYWQNETLVKSNINCENSRKNINSYDKAEIFPKKILKK